MLRDLRSWMHGWPLHGFIIAGRGWLLHAFPAGFLVPYHTHCSVLYRVPFSLHFALHCKIKNETYKKISKFVSAKQTKQKVVEQKNVMAVPETCKHFMNKTFFDNSLNEKKKQRKKRDGKKDMRELFHTHLRPRLNTPNTFT